MYTPPLTASRRAYLQRRINELVKTALKLEAAMVLRSLSIEPVPTELVEKYEALILRTYTSIRQFQELLGVNPN